MSARLFILDAAEGRVFSVKPDGTDKTIIATGERMPDGVVVDVEAGHIYWTCMGVLSRNDGSIVRADLDGRNRKTIVPEGATFTPKQLQLDKRHGRLYWCDREGMRVMRANLDGSGIETLVQTGSTEVDRRDQTRWCVGIALDHERNQIYWTQKGPDNAGRGRIFRAGIDIPRGESAESRSDIETLYDGLPEPIDLEIDHAKRILYWTDRGDPPLGNTVNRAPLDTSANGRPAPEVIFTHLMEGIGIALDREGDRMFMTDLAGSVYSARLDGSKPSVLLGGQGNLTGIAYVNLSSKEA
ncbi:3-hydroxyacyl-CoA dehydrogenase [Variovorax guangxiensis]|uniref:3-hydroxyacyl-CoA dehydrogenase n=1 Tax=Variovorax guangxiensis TaxID=1775474 RepID=UPI0028638C0D|nr:3-hydroxyacyl-CoA dehydrogenase [Variovorax guangxiensis]MDR6858540.1 sugar lactone lactonase YvrE [Variovorax guangxiensis]